MGLPFNLPENFYVMAGLTPQVGTGVDLASRAVNLKHVEKMWILVHLNPAGGAAYTLTPQTDALVAFGSAAVLTSAIPIWSSADADTTTTLTAQTEAVNFATAATADPKLVVFEIDPALLNAGERCVRVNIPALAVTDYASVQYIIVPRYSGAPYADVTVD